MPTTRPPINLLSVIANIERHKLSSGEPWILLMLIQWPGAVDPLATQQYLRLVRNTESVTFDANDGLGPQVYAPFNFEMGDLTVSSQGSVPETEVKASNVMRVLQGIIEQYAGVCGAYLTLFVMNTKNPDGEPDLSMAFTIKQSVCDAKLVTLKLGASSPLRRLFPIHMYRSNYCAWKYKGAQCSYMDPPPFTGNTTSGSAIIGSPSSMTGLLVGQTITGPGVPANATIITLIPLTLSANATATASGVSLTPNFQTCSHTIDGATGCQAHFPNTVLPALLFPGIDSNGAAVASVA